MVHARLNYRFAVLACTSVVVAIVGFLIGPIGWLIFDRGNDIPSSRTLELCIWSGWLWIALFALACVQSPRRSLWLLLAAPFALWWPGMWIFVADACSLTGRCH
jgi:hypothetical protein